MERIRSRVRRVIGIKPLEIPQGEDFWFCEPHSNRNPRVVVAEILIDRGFEVEIFDTVAWVMSLDASVPGPWFGKIPEAVDIKVKTDDARSLVARISNSPKFNALYKASRGYYGTLNLYGPDWDYDKRPWDRETKARVLAFHYQEVSDDILRLLKDWERRKDFNPEDPYILKMKEKSGKAAQKAQKILRGGFLRMKLEPLTEGDIRFLLEGVVDEFLPKATKA